MRIGPHAGTLIDFTVAGYEFPELERASYDSNWLMIAGRFEKDGRAWAFRDPCLLTHELQRLAEWFEARATDPGPDSEIGFIEPNLSFRWTKGALQVFAAAECRPADAPPGSIELRLTPSKQEMQSAAAALHADLNRFPIRPEK